MTQKALLSIPQLKKKADRLLFGNLLGSSQTLAISECAQQQTSPLILIVNDTPSALKLRQELEFFVEDNLELVTFPDWETLPYDNFSPHQDIISTRIETLYKLPNLKKAILIVPISTLLLRIAPPAYLKQHTLIIKNKQKIELQNLRADLEEAGYYAVEQVMEHGEFCARGSLLDIYPMGSDTPYRIDFFDDEIDSIRPFDSESQRSLKTIEEIKLLPAHEFATDQDAIKRFKVQFANKFTSPLSTGKESIFQEINQHNLPAGIEYYLPLFFDQTATLFDYFPSNSRLAIVGDINQAAIDFWQTLTARYQEKSVDLFRPLLPPEELYLRHEQCFAQINQWPRFYLHEQPFEQEKAGKQNCAVQRMPNVQIEHNKNEPLQQLQQFIKNFTGKILFSVESSGRKESLLELLAPLKMQLSEFSSLTAFIGSKKQIGVTISQVENSFILTDAAVAFITENELLGHKVTQRRRRKESSDDNYSSEH
ncbi:MAG TPA: transcription-repair coupling factor, partial [Psychromonas sp.]